jgi:hypothetical protein
MPITRSEEPEDRLGRIGAAMIQALEDHPETDDAVRAIILIDNPQARRGTSAAVGWADDEELLAALLAHAEAIARSHDIPFAVGEIPIGGGQG